jgi:hypothetical protein
MVLQAAADLQDEPVNSTDYEQSVAFFTGRGPWAEWRSEVAGMIDLHPDDLRRLGQRIIDKRMAEHRAQQGAGEAMVAHAPAPSPPPVEPLVIPDFVVKMREVRERSVPAHRWQRKEENKGGWVRRFAAA